MTGFLEEMEEVPSAGPETREVSAIEQSDEEEDTGPDLKEVQRRMTNIKRQYNKTLKVLEKKGRAAKETKDQFEKLGEIFKFIKFSPKMFEDLSYIVLAEI